MHGFELLVEFRDIATWRDEQIAVEPGEIAVDRFFPHDALDLVDGRRVTVGREPRAVGAVQTFQLLVAVIERVDEMRGGSAGFAAGRRTIVDDDHPLYGFGEPICGSQSGDSGPDDADVRCDVTWQRWF